MQFLFAIFSPFCETPNWGAFTLPTKKTKISPPQQAQERWQSRKFLPCGFGNLYFSIQAHYNKPHPKHNDNFAFFCDYFAGLPPQKPGYAIAYPGSG